MEETWSRMKRQLPRCEEDEEGSERGRSDHGAGSLVNHFISTAAESRSENTIKLKSVENYICL